MRPELPTHFTRSSFCPCLPNVFPVSAKRSTKPTPLLGSSTTTDKKKRDIQRTEGLRALFRGLGPTLAGAMPARSINFYVYGPGKEFYSQKLLKKSGEDSSSLIHICAAITAGIATATATNPIWVVKTRLQLDMPTSSSTLPQNPTTSNPNHRLNHPSLSQKSPLTTRANATPVLPHTSRYSTRPSNNVLQTALTPSFQCMARIYRQEGLLGFYRGLSASYLGVAEGTLQWTLYEKFKRWGASGADETSGKEHWSKKMLAAGSAKLLATGITYPHEVSLCLASAMSLTYWTDHCCGDGCLYMAGVTVGKQVVRTRMRQRPPPAPAPPKYTGLYTTIKTVFVEEGVRISFFLESTFLKLSCFIFICEREKVF